MAGQKPISVVIKGEYTDKDIKKAIADLRSLQSEAPAAASQFSGLGSTVAKLGGVLAATFAVSKIADFFQESIRGAMEDEKSLVALAKAMENVGLAQKNAAAEDLLRVMSLQYGVADDLLRPSFQRLVTATRDVERSQSLLALALDISSAGYADTESAAKALSAAAMGNFTALQRLKLPLDANTIASKDFEGAIAQLNQTVGGQAAAAADTYQGRLNRISVAAGEAKEAIGYALLDSINTVSIAFGGTDGATSAITSFGDQAADLIRGLGVLAAQIANLVPPTDDATVSTKRMSEQYKSFWEAFIKNSKSGYAPIQGLVAGIQYLGDVSEVATTETRKLTSATVQAGIAAGQSRSYLTDMTDGLAEVAAAAYEAAGGYMAFFESVVNKQRIQRDLANTSGTVTSAILEGVSKGYDLTDAKLKEIRDKIDKATKGGSRGEKKKDKPVKEAAEEFVLLDESARRALQGVNQMAMGYDNLTRSLGADDIAAFSRSMLAAGEVTEETKTQFESMVGVVRDKLNTALAAAKDRLRAVQQQYDDLNGRVQQGITAGNGLADAAQAQAEATQRLAEAQKAYDAAVKGEKPEEIEATSKALAEAKDQQGTFLTFLQKGVDSAEAFSGQIQQLIKANASLDLVSQIVQMGARSGSRIAAELLAGGAEAINQANRMVSAVSDAAATAGEMAARTFYGAGLASATAYVTALETQVQPLLQNLLNSIAAQIASALRQPVNANLGSGAPTNPTTAAIAAPFSSALGAYAPTTPGGGPNIPSGEGRIYAELRALSRRAVGGPVMSGTPYLVGEVGPEVFVPHSSGTIIPNGGLGGSTYNITVQAGVGDPRAIGQQIVEYITRWENANGQRYARTA